MSLKSELQDEARLLREAAERLEQTAALVPTSEQIEATHEQIRALAREHGQKVGVFDSQRKKLRVGDLVRVDSSERYGDGVLAMVMPGEADYQGDGKERVILSLCNGENDNYQPSVGRVTRIARYDSPRFRVDLASITHDGEIVWGNANLA